jgi:hypothetical protein
VQPLGPLHRLDSVSAEEEGGGGAGLLEEKPLVAELRGDGGGGVGGAAPTPPTPGLLIRRTQRVGIWWRRLKWLCRFLSVGTGVSLALTTTGGLMRARRVRAMYV